MSKAEKVTKPKKKNVFDDMEPGDTYHYKGSNSAGPIKLGYRLMRGKYETWPDGKGGWWLRLTKPIKHMLDD